MAAIAATAVLGGAVAPCAARADPPVASFTITPAEPLTGDAVSFASTSTGTISAESWDLDGDGRCNDATGGTAQRTYATPGTYSVKLCADGPDGEASQIRRVVAGNRPPVASFTVQPQTPHAQEPVSFASTSADPDSPIAGIDWDLNGDGVFGDGTGAAASSIYPAAGTLAVGLRVTDTYGAATIATLPVTLLPAPLAPLVPAPVVRLSGRIMRQGMVVTALRVSAAPDATVEARCWSRRGGSCRFRRLLRPRGRKSWRVGRAEGFLPAGTVLQVFIRRPGTLGRYTRFTIRPGRPPRRIDLCLPPEPARPGDCPS